MGSGVSSHAKQSDSPREDENQIDISILYSCLQKLSFAFEIKESLTRNLADEILDPAHKTFDDKFYGVEKWLQKYTDTELTPEEMYQVIKYVELFDDEKPEDDCTTTMFPPISSSIDSVSQRVLSEELNATQQHRRQTQSSESPCDSAVISPMESNEGKNFPQLFCPFRSKIGAWILSIRQQEQKRDVFKIEDDNTQHLSNVDDDERLETMRKRLSSF